MAGGKRIKTKYRGVYYRVSPTKKHQGKPDRCYVVWIKDQSGKPKWQSIGWASEGVTAEYANAKRGKLLDEIASGSAPSITARTFTVADAVAAYTTWARGEGKHIDKELNRYEKHMRPLFAALPVSSITQGMLTQHKANLAAVLAEQSITHCFSFVRAAINHAIAAELYPGPNPIKSRRNSTFRLPPPQNNAVRYFTPDEARALLDALRPRSPQLHDMSMVSLKTGMRAAEIFSITGHDLDRAAGLVHFTAKGGKRQCVHAPAEVIDLLAAYKRAPNEYIFQRRGGGPIKRGISSTFGRTCLALGLNTGDEDSRNKVRFHTWRHTFASWLAQSGKVTLQELKEMMRHEKITMTLRYAHLIPGHQKARLSIIDEVLPPS